MNALEHRISRLRELGWSIQKIAGEVHTDDVNVREALVRLGYPVQASKQKRIVLTEALIRKAIDAYQKDKSFHHVCRYILHKHREEVRKLFEERGCVIRPQGQHRGHGQECLAFSARQAALCRAYLENGISLGVAVKLYGDGIDEVAARHLLRRYEMEA
jgi:hypothetical protein